MSPEWCTVRHLPPTGWPGGWRLDGQPDVEVVGNGQRTDLPVVLADLAARGVARLLAEGGTRIHTQLLAENLAEELQVVVGPFFVGGGGAPRVGAPNAPVVEVSRDRRQCSAQIRVIGAHASARVRSRWAATVVRLAQALPQ